jgi:hypothetical protein
MTNTEALVKLGRFMITNAVRFVEDERCNRWARVGQLLTEMGMPFAPRLSELGSEQIATVREAAAIMTGKVAMPETIQVQALVEPRRTRKARMTKAMTKAMTRQVVLKPVKVTNPVKVTKPAKPALTAKPVTINPQRLAGVPSVASQVRDLIRANKNSTDELGMVEIVVRELGLTSQRGKSVVKAFWATT